MGARARLIYLVKATLRNGIPAALIFFIVRPAAPAIQRIDVGAALAGYWTFFYVRRRQSGLMLSLGEWSEMGATDWPAFRRSFRRHVPSLWNGDQPWNPYREHRERRSLRIARVDAVLRRYASDASLIVDIGSAEPLAERMADRRIVRLDLEPRSHGTVHADASAIPLRTGCVDIVVMSDAIEHLLQPDRAIWEIARILRDGGTLVLTTNNAAAMPARSPLAHPFLWIEKLIGFRYPGALSGRSWRWPVPVDANLGAGDGPVYFPHTHHIAGETIAMLDAAGLETISVATFGFPPLGSHLEQWLRRRPRLAAAIERTCSATPLVRRLGDHVVLVARKARQPALGSPRAVWPGPLSE
jgi:SAM-dependent methyltransferase